MANWISAHLRTTEWSLTPSSSSMSASANPFLPSAELDFSVESFTFATSTHYTRAKAMPTKAQIGMRIWVSSLGAVSIQPSFSTFEPLEKDHWQEQTILADI
ncbi:hypothetical protein Salat_0214400 [Sesamum alatum]|uniref:Uncharacterized protein n=1 Tax=Sesamum alatum TaxID=300844 RepID=A0AAE2CY51_9LAMI|nr:hypothetical protein Salat_0214400 [Sesamum alatum]